MIKTRFQYGRRQRGSGKIAGRNPTDRIYRLMIAHRVRHGAAAQVLTDQGAPIVQTTELLTKLFDEELDTILCELPSMKDLGTPESFRQARAVSETMIAHGEFDPS